VWLFCVCYEFGIEEGEDLDDLIDICNDSNIFLRLRVIVDG
jgi:hypothetical protein